MNTDAYRVARRLAVAASLLLSLSVAEAGPRNTRVAVAYPTPAATRPAYPPAPSAHQLAQLYRDVGRTLSDLSRVDASATLDLWPRYRWVNFLDAVKTPAKRAAAATLLERLLADTKRLIAP